MDMSLASGVSADIAAAAPQPSRQTSVSNSSKSSAEHSFSSVLADRETRAQPRADRDSSAHASAVDSVQEKTNADGREAAQTAVDSATDISATESRDATETSPAQTADEANAVAQQEQDQAADMLQRLQASRQMADSLQPQAAATDAVIQNAAVTVTDTDAVPAGSDSSSQDVQTAADSTETTPDPATLLATLLPPQATLAAVQSSPDSAGEAAKPVAVGAPVQKQALPAETATPLGADDIAATAAQVDPAQTTTEQTDTSVQPGVSAALTALLDKKPATDGVDPLHARLQEMAENIAKGQSPRHLVLDDASAVPMTQTPLASAMQTAMQQKGVVSGEGHDAIAQTDQNALQDMSQIQVTQSDAPTASELALAGQNADKLTPALDDSQKSATKTPVLPSLYLQNAQPDEQALGARILMMAGQKWHEAELELEPQGMGKLKIQLTMDAEQQTNVQFIAQQAHVKEMLEQSLPKFREWLNQNGFQAGQTQVQTQADWGGQQSQTFGQNGSDDSRSNAQSGYQNGSPTETDAAPAAILAKIRGNQGVDFYA
jgi:flagellar hook-length control protein FliK